MAYFTKNKEGEFVEVSDDAMFKERHDRWVETESAKIRKDVEKAVRDELSPVITKEVEEKVKVEWQSKLDGVETKSKELETSLRRKTIAAEYGFKPETEKYLGSGTDEEMRKEADTLKSNFAVNAKAPEKQTASNSDSGFIKLEKS